MDNSEHQGQSRREFIRGVTRYLTLGGLLSVAGVLYARDRNQPQTESYRDHRLCDGCSLLSNCGLPQAVAFRQG